MQILRDTPGGVSKPLPITGAKAGEDTSGPHIDGGPNPVSDAKDGVAQTGKPIEHHGFVKPPVHKDDRDAPGHVNAEREDHVEHDASERAKLVNDLKRDARDTAGDSALDPDAPLSDGRNAHKTNTPDEMRDELHKGKNWLEGDLRLDDDGNPVLSHDDGDEDKGLKLDEWLAIGKEGKRGVKVDVKENAALPKMLDALDTSGIDQRRMMINVTDVSDDQAKEIRKRFPDAWISLCPNDNGKDSYDASDLDHVIEQADAIGGRISFPMRWDKLSDDDIERLKPHGKVSIWTDEGQGVPDDAGKERRKLQDRGVDGMIDIGAPASTFDKLVVQPGNDLMANKPVDAAKHLAGGALDTASAGVHEVTSFVGGLFG